MPVEPDALATWANAITVARLLLSPLMFWLIPDDRQGAWVGVRAVVRAVRQRRHRRLPRPPARHHPLGRLPRPAGRQGARARGDVRARRRRRVLDGAGRDHRRPRGGHQRLPHRSSGAKGVSVPASKLAKFKTLAQQLAVGFALLAAHGRPMPRGCGSRCCGPPSCSTVVSGVQYLWRAARIEHERDADRRARRCSDAL